MVKIPMHNVKTGKSIGYVVAKNTHYGLLLIPYLHGLPPGLHGFHLHAKPSCGHQGKDAGGHLVGPGNLDRHLGPYRAKGHLGDLPALFVDKNGQATLPVLAPKLTEQQLYHHALIIHAGGDNYADHPKKLGGGGQRIACGVVK